MKKALLIVLFLGIASAANAEDSVISNAKEAVSRGMKDPSSTQFRDVKKIKNSLGETSVCGQVNAKNSYGGYVGFSNFSFHKGGYSIVNEKSSYLELLNYGASGCGGELKDKVAHDPSISRSSCEISWKQISDVVLFGRSKEEAVDNAINTIKSKNKSLTESQISQLRQQNMQSLQLTLSSPSVVDRIKTQTNSFRASFIDECDVATRMSLLR